MSIVVAGEGAVTFVGTGVGVAVGEGLGVGIGVGGAVARGVVVVTVAAGGGTGIGEAVGVGAAVLPGGSESDCACGRKKGSTIMRHPITKITSEGCERLNSAWKTLIRFCPVDPFLNKVKMVNRVMPATARMAPKAMRNISGALKPPPPNGASLRGLALQLVTGRCSSSPMTPIIPLLCGAVKALCAAEVTRKLHLGRYSL